MEKAKAFDKMSILFDFDGTVGDTETPAMEVAFWELAPYLVNTRESRSRTPQAWGVIYVAHLAAHLGVLTPQFAPNSEERLTPMQD